MSDIGGIKRAVDALAGREPGTRVLRISKELIAGLFRQGGKIGAVECISGLPSDVRVTGASCQVPDSIDLHLESSTYEGHVNMPIEPPVYREQTSDAERYFRMAYRAVLALAKRCKDDPDAMHKGQDWSGLVGSSHSMYLHRAREEAGIDHDEFLQVVRESGIDISDIYEEGCEK